MAAGHFTTIPCEPNTVNRKLESHFFSGIGPHTNNIVCAKFSTFLSFLIFFVIDKLWVNGKLWVNVPFAMSFCVLYLFD